MNSYEYIQKEYNIDEKVSKIAEEAEQELKQIFAKIEDIGEINQYKVLQAMQKNKLSDIHFSTTTGYGYNDIGRDTLENIYADVFKAEAALVRPQIISGTHALTVALFGNLHYGDRIVSLSGKPYDTLEGVIGIRKTKGSLIEHGIIYEQVELINDLSFDLNAITKALEVPTKMVLIQRSKGYSWRHSFSVFEIGQVIKHVKSIDENIICLVDNCYGEFVEITEPTEVGADILVGSLIKNPGGGLAPVGGYIVGKEEYVENAAYRLSAPGLGKEVGPSLGVTTSLMQGLFLAPNVVSGSLKTATFAALILEKLGYLTCPKHDELRHDIVQAVKFGNAKDVILFCEGIQKSAPVDSFVVPVPWAMPGYDSEVIMASGSFIQGSSIELSADAPIKEPYICYMQGGLTWFHGKIGVIISVDHMLKNK